jgi:hypothetical protein
MEAAMPARTPRDALLGQLISLVSIAIAAGAFFIQCAVNWARGERLLTAMFLLSLPWLAFGIVVVSRRILKTVPN